MTAQVDYPASDDSYNPDHITMPRVQYERMCAELDHRRPGSINELVTSVASPGPLTFEEGDTLTIGGRRAIWRDHIWHWAPDDDKAP
jgi:hypothetical protein